MAGGRDFLIDYDLLRGRQNETVVIELCMASAARPGHSASRAPTRRRIMARQRTA